MLKQAIKGWSGGRITQIDTGSPSLLNIDFDKRGVARPRKSWKTFAGMVYQLWLINKRYQKSGIKGNFTVQLPLPDGNYRRAK